MITATHSDPPIVLDGAVVLHAPVSALIVAAMVSLAVPASVMIALFTWAAFTLALRWRDLSTMSLRLLASRRRQESAEHELK